MIGSEGNKETPLEKVRAACTQRGFGRPRGLSGGCMQPRMMVGEGRRLQVLDIHTNWLTMAFQHNAFEIFLQEGESITCLSVLLKLMLWVPACSRIWYVGRESRLTRKKRISRTERGRPSITSQKDGYWLRERRIQERDMGESIWVENGGNECNPEGTHPSHRIMEARSKQVSNCTYVLVYVQVSLYAFLLCLCAHVCLSLPSCVIVCRYACLYVCAHMHVPMSTCVYISTWVLCMSACTCMHVCCEYVLCAHVYVCVWKREWEIWIFIVAK